MLRLRASAAAVPAPGRRGGAGPGEHEPMHVEGIHLELSLLQPLLLDESVDVDDADHEAAGAARRVFCDPAGGGEVMRTTQQTLRLLRLDTLYKGCFQLDIGCGVQQHRQRTASRGALTGQVPLRDSISTISHLSA